MASLGIRFKPDEPSAQMGRPSGSTDGVQRAIQLVSLRWPKVMGGRSPVGDPALLAGNAPRLSGFNPDAAILQAMIRALAGGGSVVSEPLGSGSPAPRVPSRAQMTPQFTPGVETSAGPLPTGPVTKEWDVSQDVLPTPPREPSAFQTAATRSSRGYGALRDKYDFLASGVKDF